MTVRDNRSPPTPSASRKARNAWTTATAPGRLEWPALCRVVQSNRTRGAAASSRLRANSGTLSGANCADSIAARNASVCRICMRNCGHPRSYLHQQRRLKFSIAWEKCSHDDHTLQSRCLPFAVNTPDLQHGLKILPITAGQRSTLRSKLCCQLCYKRCFFYQCCQPRCRKGV